ncbi:hypothetical protein HYH03_014902 [Edaphochlamys debaryana]|uniref:Uncharacterized protein n=1 Tax=Edaphochlamys debaryana TaxID=47281 RepID=A0A835XT64_9CHLO|nr:hypothetical protein HYH03_014902 [Edaphochlamys debaryana]|eukprot:KAG2486455.1 hypothetical protein HYH03_014902 [Edaphochlamys debaryana]
MSALTATIGAAGTLVAAYVLRDGLRDGLGESSGGVAGGVVSAGKAVGDGIAQLGTQQDARGSSLAPAIAYAATVVCVTWLATRFIPGRGGGR